MYDIAKIDVILPWIEVKIWRHFIALTILDGEQFWHGSDVEASDENVSDLESEAEAAFFRGPWFSVVDHQTFQLPEPDFTENAGPVNLCPG